MFGDKLIHSIRGRAEYGVWMDGNPSLIGRILIYDDAPSLAKLKRFCDSFDSLPM